MRKTGPVESRNSIGNM